MASTVDAMSASVRFDDLIFLSFQFERSLDACPFHFKKKRAGKGSKFCAKYNVNILVYYEIHLDIRDAIKRETQIKRWNRQWKIDLIKSRNPELRDLLEKRFPLAWE